ncbi:Rv3235 family protein [Streptomyces sp. NPDC048002]|uniref:Rv3235 family protein n=1 Tax=Streptomyces sp. NPDC048002 TaxID=3154344 RepID=UPI0034013271
MTRAKNHPGARPPGRRDSRRPGGAPPRAPGGAPGPAARAAAAEGARLGAADTASAPGEAGSATAHTASAYGRSGSATTGAYSRSGSGAAGALGARGGPRSGATGARGGPGSGAPGVGGAVGREAAAGPGGAAPQAAYRVPHQTPRRPVAPQPRPTDVFADRLLAVLSGRRPVHYMLRHTAGRAYDDLAWLAERGPLRAARGTGGTGPVIRDIGYYVPSPGAIEAFARIGAGDRLRAMAFRLEQGRDLRWRCTAVELGGPARPRAGDD